MSTSKRLSEVFNTAERITLDKNSKLIFFSDIHRGDNSWADEFARNRTIFYHALHYYLDEGYTYIEVGDGDELSKNDNFDRIRNAHQEIFALMKAFYDNGRLYMLFGNHDIARRDPSIVQKSLFSYWNGEDNQQKVLFEGIRVHEGLVLRDRDTGKEIFIVHGHQGDFMNDTLGLVSQLLLRKLWRPLQLYGFQDPTRAATNNEMRIKVEEKIIDWIITNQQPTLCGHTHRPNLPVNGGPPYFNTGSCVHPRWITGIEIINHQIMLVRWMVNSDKLGILRVERDILAGPRKLGDFF